MKRLLGLAVGVAVAAVLGGAATASAQTGGGCQLQGTANISPGLSTTAQNFTYSFTGNLTNCQSSTAGSAASDTTNTINEGSVAASQVAIISQLPCD